MYVMTAAVRSRKSRLSVDIAYVNGQWRRFLLAATLKWTAAALQRVSAGLIVASHPASVFLSWEGKKIKTVLHAKKKLCAVDFILNFLFVLKIPPTRAQRRGGGGDANRSAIICFPLGYNSALLALISG